MADIEHGNGWTMYRGDCTDILPTLDPVDHIITDPPYEAECHTSARRSRRGPTGPGFVSMPLGFDAMTPELRAYCGFAFALLCRRWCIVFSQIEGVPLWRTACGDKTKHGLKHARSCVWIKPDSTPQFTGDRPGSGYEMMEIMHAQNGRWRWNGGGRRGVFVHNCNSQKRNPDEDHQTPKPEPLMLELVELFTDPGETVLDAFAGSGTTGAVAVRTGRRFIGIEKERRWFDHCCERLRAEESGSTLQAQRSGQGALFG